MTARDDLAKLLHDADSAEDPHDNPEQEASCVELYGQYVDIALEAGWRPPARVVSTREEADALPAGVVVRSSSSTVACRHDTGIGVLFGDERPFEWSLLSLPLTVIHEAGA